MLLARQVDGLGFLEFDEEFPRQFVHLASLDPHKAFLFERLDDGDGAAGVARQFPGRQGSARLGQAVEHPALLRQDPIRLRFLLLGPHDKLNGLESGAPLHSRGENRLEHLPDRRHIVPAHPEGQVHEVLGEERLGIHRFQDLLDRGQVRLIQARDDPADQFSVPASEGHAHPLACVHPASEPLRHAVRERAVQADRQGDRHEGRFERGPRRRHVGFGHGYCAHGPGIIG